MDILKKKADEIIDAKKEELKQNVHNNMLDIVASVVTGGMMLILFSAVTHRIVGTPKIRKDVHIYIHSV